MPTTDQLEREVIAWAADRGILDNSTPVSQYSKTLEEVTELLEAILDDNPVEIRDAIGDIIVTLIIQCTFWGVNINDCLNDAFEVISKRKGKMVNGVFVKDED